MRSRRNAGAVVAVAAVLAAPLAGAAQTPKSAPMPAGCYERVYGATHLSAHRGQLVVRATLAITPAPAQMATDRADPIIANGDLKFWVRGESRSFDSLGACRTEGGGLLCGGSLSAAEADTCKSGRDGVRRCRIDAGDAGSFQVEARPDGVLVTIRHRLELVPAPYDGGPFLYVSPANAENRAFQLTSAPAACK